MHHSHGRCPAPGRYDAAELEQHTPDAQPLWSLMQAAMPGSPVSATLFMALCWSLSCFQPLYRDDDGGEGLFAMSYPNCEGSELSVSDQRLIDLYAPVFRVVLPAIAEAVATGPFSLEILMALAWEESGLETDAISPSGGEGLYSMTLAQARAVAPELKGQRPNLCNPAVAAHLARRYLTRLLERYQINLALLAFHFGDAPEDVLRDHPEAAAFLRRFYSTLAYISRTRPWERPVSEHATTTYAYQAIMRRTRSKGDSR